LRASCTSPLRTLRRTSCWQALSDEGIVFALPYRSLAAFVLAAIAVGILAAILPARRAARLNVLEALQYE
jgi:putative ABC transport system permease protein